MAVTTEIDEIVHRPTGNLFFGRPVPSIVTHVAMDYDVLNDCRIIRWRTSHNVNDPIYSMDFYEPTEENIQAVLVAMRLSC